MTADRTVASMEADNYQRKLSAVAEGLRRLADEVEREGRVRGPGAMGTGAHAWAAHNVFHSLMWGLANLNADGLIDAAGRADTAASEEARL